MGRDLKYRGGSYYVTDDRTGFPQRAERTRKEWTGLRVDDAVWEARQPQDLVRGSPDRQDVPDPRPLGQNQFIGPIFVQTSQAAAPQSVTIYMEDTSPFYDGVDVSVILDNGVNFFSTVQGDPTATWIVLSDPIPYSAAQGNIVTRQTSKKKVSRNIPPSPPPPPPSPPPPPPPPSDPPPQYPHAFTQQGYVSTPTRTDVIGVNIGAGYPLNTVHKVLGIDSLPENASWNAPASLVRLDGDGIDLDAWDLSGNLTYITGNNCSVTKCKWNSTNNGKAFVQLAASVTGCVINYNNVDQMGHPSDNDALIFSVGAGDTEIKFNWLRNAHADAISLGTDTPLMVAPNVQDNLFDEIGLAGVVAHADCLQCFGTGTYTVICSRNTVKITNPQCLVQVFSCADNGNLPTCVSAQYEDNVLISPNPPTFDPDTGGALTGVNWNFAEDTSSLVTTCSILRNFADPLGLIVGFNSQRHYGGPHNGTVVQSGNVNMRTGGSI